MTQHIDTYDTSGTVSLPANLVSTNLAVTAIGSPSGNSFLSGQNAGAYVSGQIPASMFPLTLVIGEEGSSAGDGGNGYSGGGAGQDFGGGGSTAVLSAGALLIEAGGQDGAFPGGDPQGSGGGYASNTPPNASSGNGAASGGSQGGTGGNTVLTGTSVTVTGGTGNGGGTNGNSASGATSGAGVGSGGLTVNNCAASFAASAVISYQYGQGPSSGTHSGSVAITYDVADPPNAPISLTPAGGSYADTNANGITLGGTYSTPGADTGALLGVAIKLRIDGGSVHYWDGTDFSSTSEVFVTPTTGIGVTNGETFTVVIPAGILADGHTYTWSMACQEGFAELEGSFSATQTFIGAPTPSAVITSPASTVTTLTPNVTWTPTTPAGSQTDYRFAIYDAPTETPGTGTAVYDTGVVASSSHNIAIPSATLSSVATYYGYLQITETGGQTSAWMPFVFTVQLVDSVAPTLTGSITTEPTSGCPAPLLTANAGTGGTANPNVRFQADYTGEGDWNDILGYVEGETPATALVNPVSHIASVYDMGAPFNIPLYYRARNEAVSGGETYISAWSATLTL